MDYETYIFLSNIFYIAGGVLFVVSVIIFFALRIPFNIGYATNYSKKKGIRLIRDNIAGKNTSIPNSKSKTEEKAYKKAKTTSDLTKHERNVINRNSTAETSKMNKGTPTTNLKKSKKSEKKGTQKLNRAVIVSQEYDGYGGFVFPVTHSGAEFNVLQEFVFTSSYEIIL